MASRKVVRIFYLIYRHCTVDIFFVDWEKSRTKTEPKAPKAPAGTSPVSIWRTILATNEWNKFQVSHFCVNFDFL